MAEPAGGLTAAKVATPGPVGNESPVTVPGRGKRLGRLLGVGGGADGNVAKPLST